MIIIIDKHKGIPVYGWIASKEKLDILEKAWKASLDLGWYVVMRYDK